jgi:MFS family permease
MKLDYKKTILVGLAFFSISAFWQMYDNVVPKILENTFNMGETVTGIVMAMDNVLALILLPVFGAVSDRAGRRMPFIVGGTVLAVALTIALAFLNAPGRLVPFLIVLGCLLLSMSLYRSPAVALMPDVTPKPLRSRGNAVINLMGSLGGLFTLVSTMFLVQTRADGSESYTLLFITVAIVMVLAVFTMIFTVNERKLKQQMLDINYGVDPADEEQQPQQGDKKAKLPRDVKRSLILILVSVSLWFFAYNAITTAFTRYAQNVWGMGTGAASVCLTVAMGAALIGFIPIGHLSARLGRKRTILIGVATLTVALGIAALFARNFSLWFYPLFALVGIGWAAINVNSFPMVVEISHAGDIGKYTGYYYTFSMAAQILTPVISGAIIEAVEKATGSVVVGYSTLFPYAFVFSALAFVTMCFVRHGDAKPAVKSNLEMLAGGDD